MYRLEAICIHKVIDLGLVDTIKTLIDRYLIQTTV